MAREYLESHAQYLAAHPRAGWDEAFARMAAAGDDRLLDVIPTTSSFDDTEWEWPHTS